MLDAYSQELNLLFNDVYESVGKMEQNLLSKTGLEISISELHILEAIWEHRETGCSISDLAEAQQVTLPSMTIAVKKLEQKGYVTKRRSAEDGRVVVVELTRMGEKVNTSHRYFHEHMVRALLRDVTEDQKPILLSALRNMNNFIHRQLELSESKQQK